VPTHGNVIRSLVAREAHVAVRVSASWPFSSRAGRADRALRPDQPARRLFLSPRAGQPAFAWSSLLEGRLMFVHGGQPQAMLRYGLHRQA
jgi:hypothetical protein